MIDVLKQALEALKRSHPYSNSYADLSKHSESISALFTAIKQMEKVEPVATYAGRRDLPSGTTEFWGYLWNQDVKLEKGQKLFTYPIEDWMLKPMLVVDHTAPVVPEYKP